MKMLQKDWSNPTISSFKFTVDRHLNRYGIPTQKPTISTWINDELIPENTIFMYDSDRIKIVHNIDTGEEKLVIDYKPSRHKKKEGRITAKNRQRKHC